ncbi:MAG: hypothetical protein Q9161_008587 [Pseudevernia consocians]
MTESQLDPITRPNSTVGRLPALAQLHFVNAGLENNSHPREHYCRQFSVTPERQTPQSQRTPHITWPEIDPIEDLREAKAWAANEAKCLEKFYDGRVLLRKEEPERYGIFGENPAYWDSQTSHWKIEYKKLEEEYGHRKQLEVEGKVHEGFAQALLLSPIQSPSPPPSDGILRATANGVKKHNTTATRPSRKPVAKSPLQPHKKRQLSRLTSGESPNSISKASERRKYRETEKEQDMGEETWAPASLDKRARRQPIGPISKHSPDLNSNGAPGLRKNDSRDLKSTAKIAKRQKNARSRAPRVLPWTLRSRDAISHRETSTRAASKNNRRPDKGKALK